MSPTVAGVVVTYNSDVDLLDRTITALAPELDPLVVIDNSDDAASADAIAACCARRGPRYRTSGGNVGIATAQNRGVEEALGCGAEYVLFLDDDSELEPGAPTALAAALKSMRRSRPEVVAVGPLIRDRRTEESLVFAWRGRLIRQLTQLRPSDRPVDVAFLLSSGSVIATDAFVSVGLFRDEYFIDHVDQEWGLRAGTRGAAMCVVPDVTLTHSLGDRPPRAVERNSAYYTHASPLRDYYLTRNAFLIFRDVPLPWIKFIGRARLLAESSVRKVLRPIHPGQRRAVLDGIWDGMRGHSGVAGSTVAGRVPFRTSAGGAPCVEPSAD